MALGMVTYLREAAQNCIRLARSCPHPKTAHGLEELAADFMSKALELEKAVK